jgi:RES domain-containing protein
VHRERRDAEETILRAPRRDFHGPVWRVHWKEVAATDWSLSLQSSGRYHRGLDLFVAEQTWPALYTSLAPEVAIWEMVRRSAASDLAYLRNNVLSELTLDINDVWDLTEPTSLGLALADLTGHDRSICQSLAAAAVSLGCQGLLVPSAALPGSNLVLFPRNWAVTTSVRLVRSAEMPLDSLPASAPDGPNV